MTDPLTALRDEDPAANSDLEPDAAARIDAAVERAFEQWDGHAVTSRRGGRMIRRRTAGAVLVTAAACSFGLAIVQTDKSGRGAGVDRADARSVLRAARAATMQGPVQGPWTRFVTRGTDEQTTMEEWVSDDGELMRRDASAPNLHLADGTTLDLRNKLVVIDRSASSWEVDRVRRLPSEPDALEAALEKDSAGVVTQAAQILLSPVASDGQRAALFTILLRTPRARFAAVTDPLGRQGDGVNFKEANDHGGENVTFVFDRGTHRLLGIRSINDQRRFPPRKVFTSWALILDARRFAHAPRPDLRETFPKRADGKKEPRYLPVGG